jgi:choline dehydrogenase
MQPIQNHRPSNCYRRQTLDKIFLCERGELDLHITATLIASGSKSHRSRIRSCDCINNPQSRGTVKLSSKDPNATPVIDLNFLAVEEDRKRLLEGSIARRLAKSASLKDDR